MGKSYLFNLAFTFHAFTLVSTTQKAFVHYPTTITFDEQVAGGADGSRLTGGGAGEAAAVFSKRLTNHQPGESVLVGDLEVDGALNLVVLSEPHDDRSRVTADLTLQGHRLALRHCHVLQALNSKKVTPSDTWKD